MWHSMGWLWHMMVPHCVGPDSWIWLRSFENLGICLENACLIIYIYIYINTLKGSCNPSLAGNLAISQPITGSSCVRSLSTVMLKVRSSLRKWQVAKIHIRFTMIIFSLWSFRVMMLSTDHRQDENLDSQLLCWKRSSHLSRVWSASYFMAQEFPNKLAANRYQQLIQYYIQSHCQHPREIEELDISLRSFIVTMVIEHCSEPMTGTRQWAEMVFSWKLFESTKCT